MPDTAQDNAAATVAAERALLKAPPAESLRRSVEILMQLPRLSRGAAKASPDGIVQKTRMGTMEVTPEEVDVYPALRCDSHGQLVNLMLDTLTNGLRNKSNSSSNQKPLLLEGLKKKEMW